MPRLARKSAGCRRNALLNFAAGWRETPQDADKIIFLTSPRAAAKERRMQTILFFYLRRGLARKSAGCGRSYLFNFAAGWRERAQDADKNIFNFAAGWREKAQDADEIIFLTSPRAGANERRMQTKSSSLPSPRAGAKECRMQTNLSF